MCLGQEDSADFTSAARSKNWKIELKNAITEAISRKPKGHDCYKESILHRLIDI